jgi:AcrB/AcrD/AcrF family
VPQGNPSAPFIARPVTTTLLTIGVALAGFFAFLRLPVAPLPPVDYPTITVNANMPGASPATMAATVATPLERHLGIIADVTGISSESTVGITRIRRMRWHATTGAQHFGPLITMHRHPRTRAIVAGCGAMGRGNISLYLSSRA